jgi:hypothetical protein
MVTAEEAITSRLAVIVHFQRSRNFMQGTLAEDKLECMTTEAPYGYMLDPATGQVRPRKRPGRPRVHQVADESDPEEHRAAVRARERAHTDRHPGYRKGEVAAWQASNPGSCRAHGKRSHKKLKHQVIEAYGGYCFCCGEADLRFLTIDHVANDGAAHRRQIAAERGLKNSRVGGGNHMYRWLRDNGYPPGIQVLCANCNFGKQWNGGVCPHQVIVDALFLGSGLPERLQAEGGQGVGLHLA